MFTAFWGFRWWCTDPFCWQLYFGNFRAASSPCLQAQEVPSGCWGPLCLWRWFIMGPSLPLFSPKVGQTQIRGTQHTQWMPAYSCLQPRHTYTDNNPQLNRCSSVNTSWMADSSALIIFLTFAWALCSHSWIINVWQKIVIKILIFQLLHKMPIH